MSSIRLYILGALDEHGPMHGHQLKLLAEEEHIDIWTDISVGALYGAVKRLAAEGLIEEVRTEREGSYPERQVYGITATGVASLAALRRGALRELVMKPDPFDLAMARLDRSKLDELPDVVSGRLDALRAQLDHTIAHTRNVSHHLTPTERFVMTHDEARIRAEIQWHQDLLAALPTLIADETARQDNPNV
jgi:DNA-binding PadR family transcriptional regulator